MADGRDVTLRLFVAVRAPLAVREAAQEAVEQLRDHTHVRWVTGHLLHITLLFLGETPGTLLPDLRRRCREIANSHSHFVIELSNGGAFPGAAQARTVWLGVEPVGELTSLAEALGKAAAELGLPVDRRPFRAHLTLGRVRPATAGLREALNRLPVRRVAWPVSQMELVQSVLGPGGPEYITLGAFELGREGERLPTQGAEEDEERGRWTR